jgi:hypothetical protein
MKHGDDLDAAWTALTLAMSTDTRFSVDEMAALAAIQVIQAANGTTTVEQDSLVVSLMKKFVTQPVNYT